MRNRNLPHMVCFDVIVSNETDFQLASRSPNPHICCVNQNSSRFVVVIVPEKETKPRMWRGELK